MLAGAVLASLAWWALSRRFVVWLGDRDARLLTGVTMGALALVALLVGSERKALAFAVVCGLDLAEAWRSW